MSQLGVVIPAGPREQVADTVASVLAFGGPDIKVVVVDDSGQPARLSPARQTSGPSVTVVPAPAGASGGHGGLWVKITAGLRQLMANDPPKVVLRMDTDALMIKPGLVRLAAQRFAADPQVGILGAVTMSPDGGRRDWSPAARQLASETGVRGLRHPRLRRQLRSIRNAAEESGYVAGEHALGGAYLLSSGFATWIVDTTIGVDHTLFAHSKLGEDHIAGLLCRAAGFSLQDFSGPGDVLAVTWKGLPMSPESLLAGEARVVHSVRYFDNRAEEEIRTVFRRAREAM